MSEFWILLNSIQTRNYINLLDVDVIQITIQISKALKGTAVKINEKDEPIFFNNISNLNYSYFNEEKRKVFSVWSVPSLCTIY